MLTSHTSVPKNVLTPESCLHLSRQCLGFFFAVPQPSLQSPQTSLRLRCAVIPRIARARPRMASEGMERVCVTTSVKRRNTGIVTAWGFSYQTKIQCWERGRRRQDYLSKMKWGSLRQNLINWTHLAICFFFPSTFSACFADIALVYGLQLSLPGCL